MRRQDQHTHSGQPGRNGHRGSIVLYIILGLAAFGILAAAGANRFGASVLSTHSPNCATQARYMAESGVRFAAAYLRGATTQADLNARMTALTAHGEYTVDAARGLKFTLVVGPNGVGNAQVNATGSACGGIIPTAYPQTAMSVNVPALPGGGSEVTFNNVGDDFFNTTDLLGTGAITVDPVAKTISFGNLSQGHNAAAVWYAGNATGGCTDGNCTMNNGLRAYFDVQWNNASVADGLVFGVMSATTNKLSAVGGDVDMGELMGWSGPGTSGVGLAPPKLGLEFDTYYNSCNTPVYVAGSRCDPASQTDHMAYVFWGSNAVTSGTVYSNYYGRNVTKSGNYYDDNRHGAGSGSSTEPVSSNDPDDNGNGLFGMYYLAANNWLRNGTKYYVRYELTRLTTAGAGAAYCYQLKTWVTTTAPSADYKNVLADYDANANPPTLQQVIFLNATYHSQLNKIFFGWTEATGDSTQTITVGNFGLAFKAAQPVYGATPATPVLHWPMSDNLGTSVTDAGPNGFTGTITGTARWVPGIANPNGAALYFNGSTYLSRGDNNLLDLRTAGSVSLWFKRTAAATNTWLLHKGTTSTNNEAFGLGINANGQLFFRLRNSNNNPPPNTITATAISTTVPALNTWYHVAAVWTSPGTLTIYVNGVSQGSVAAITARDSGGALFVGAGDTGTGEFTGVIDEVYLYGRVLTQAEITDLATGKP